MRGIVLNLCMLCALGAWAVEADTLQVNMRTVDHYSPVVQAVGFAYDGSPANMMYRYGTSLNDIRGTWDYRHENEAVNLWDGDRESLWRFDADSYLRLTDNTVVYGSAGYANGKIHNVLWNSTADYALLYPYVLADSLGGDVSHEKYYFRGGYAHSFGRWTYGLSADYRAVHDYRSRDPRPRSMATDLTVNVSANRRVGEWHALGADASVRFYKQVQDVKYFSQQGANAGQLHFTGLGQSYTRIDGTTYTETRHKGLGFSGAVSLVPTDALTQGRLLWTASGEYSYLRMRQQIHELNEVPLTTLHTHSVSGGVGCSYNTPTLRRALVMEGCYRYQRGLEAVVDNGLLGEYAVLDNHAMYHSRTFNGTLTGVAEWLRGVNRFAVVPRVGIFSFSEDYVDPYGKRDFSRLNTSLTLRYTRLSAWMYEIALIGCQSTNLSKICTLNASAMDAPVFAYLNYEFNRLTDNVFTVSLEGTVQRALGRTGAVSGTAAVAYDTDKRITCTVSVGYRF